MRTTYTWLASMLVLSGCSLVLGLDQHQGGDAGSFDAGIDARVEPRVDGGTDASVSDADAPDGTVPGDDAGPNDGGPDDGGAPTVGVGGTVVGLPAGATLRLRNGTETEDVAGGSGTLSFSFRVPAGESYEITIDSAPATLLCRIHRGGGTADDDVTNVFVGCSTAVDLVSFFPFDGDLHAARGDDWTSMSGAGVYTADRTGAPGMALDAVTGLDLRLSRPLNGTSTTVAPNSTQFTVTAWVRVPPSLASGTNQPILSHSAPTALSTELRIQWRSGAPFVQHYFYWDGSFDPNTYTDSTTTLDREWHHVAMSASGPSGTGGPTFVRTIYVDGVREATTATCCGWGNNTTYWALVSAAIQRDDVRLYSRMLSDDEIAGIYAAENVP